MLTGHGRFANAALPEWNVRRIGADSVWHQLGYNGDSIVVGNISTGINYRHVDLMTHLWINANYPHSGWNFETNTNDPWDLIGAGFAVGARDG